MPRILLALSLFISFGLNAQTYHFDQTYEYFEKTIAFGTVHGYLPITTDTTDSVAMRWVARVDTNTPQEWVFNFDDQNNLYLPVNHLDSADFYLKPPAAFDQKMIIGLAHNLAPSRSSIYFTIFPLHDRSDSTIIEFEFNIIYVQLPNDTTDTTVEDTTGGTGFNAALSESDISVYWNNRVEINSALPFDEILIYDMNGRILFSELDRQASRRITLNSTSSMIIVGVRRKNEWVNQLILKQ